MLQFLVPSLIGGLGVAMGSLVGRAAIALGVGAVTYTGMSFGVAEIKQYVISTLSGLPTDAVNLLAYFWIDKALTVIFSATATAMSLQLVGGSLKKIVMK
jgi:hypothetical protein